MAKQDVYMPLIIGDWLKGTRGMKAEVRGVYINLLLFQWDNGYIPEDMEELSLIDPELPKVWVKLKEKFEKIAPGKLQNKKNEEVRNFWAKQSVNGKKGGRPKTQKEPKSNPNAIPNNKLHNEHGIDIDSVPDSEVKGAGIVLRLLPIPQQVDCEAFFQGCGKTRLEGEIFFHHYEKKNWVDGSGQKITNWASLASEWIKNPKKDYGNRQTTSGNAEQQSAKFNENYHAFKGG